MSPTGNDHIITNGDDAFPLCLEVDMGIQQNVAANHYVASAVYLRTA